MQLAAGVDSTSKSTGYIKLLQFWDFSIFSVFKVNFQDISTDWPNTVLKNRKIKHTHKHFDKDVCKADKTQKWHALALRESVFSN